jgi:hypothetical protein
MHPEGDQYASAEEIYMHLQQYKSYKKGKTNELLDKL